MMKFKKTVQLGVAVASFALAANSLPAATNWNALINANFNWEDTTTPAWDQPGYPDAAGEYVIVNQQGGGSRTVTMSAPRTVGTLLTGRGGTWNAGVAPTRYWNFTDSVILDNTGGVGKPTLGGGNSSYGYSIFNNVLAGSQGVRFWRNVTVGVGGNNTFTGDVDIEDATTVRILNANALPSGARTGDINLMPNPSSPLYGSTLDLYGTSITINGLNSSPASILQNRVTSDDGGDVTLTLGDNNANGNFEGVIQNGSATLSLTKIGTGTQTLAGINTYTGDTTISAGEIVLADDGQLAFAIGANGVNNWLTGVGTLTLDGDFSFDLSGADDMTAGNSWNIVDVAGLTETYSATFSVLGFSESSDVWTMTAGNGRLWTFTEASGVLTVVPEPSTLVLGLLGGLGVLVLLRRRSP